MLNQIDITCKYYRVNPPEFAGDLYIHEYAILKETGEIFCVHEVRPSGLYGLKYQADGKRIGMVELSRNVPIKLAYLTVLCDE